jgi:hypothetical protein
MQHAVAVMLDLERQPCRRAPGPDPRIHIARPPIIGRDRVRPVAVAPVEPREIGSSQKPILDQIEPVAAAQIGRRRSRDLHRTLGGGEFRAPHRGIGAVARFGAVNGKGDAIEIGAPRRREQLRGRAARYREWIAPGPNCRRTAQHGDRRLPPVGKADDLGIAAGLASGLLRRRGSGDGLDHRPTAQNLHRLHIPAGKGDDGDAAMRERRRWRLGLAAHDPDWRQLTIAKFDHAATAAIMRSKSRHLIGEVVQDRRALCQATGSTLVSESDGRLASSAYDPSTIAT